MVLMGQMDWRVKEIVLVGTKRERWMGDLRMGKAAALPHLNLVGRRCCAAPTEQWIFSLGKAAALPYRIKF
jgi:hypothetical protein